MLLGPELDVLASRLTEAEMQRIQAAVGLLLLVTDRHHSLVGYGPNFTRPKNGHGWRIWKASGWELVDYLGYIDRRALSKVGDVDLDRQAADQILDEAGGANGIPIIVDNANTAAAFGHDAPPLEWSWARHPFGIVRLPPRLRISPEIAGVFDAAALLAVYPRWAQVAPAEILPCGLRCEAHPAHRRQPTLRILCRGDAPPDRQVVFPYWPPPSAKVTL